MISLQGDVDVVLVDAGHSSDAIAGRIERLKATWPNAKLVVICRSDGASEILGHIESGASGYLAADGSVDDLVDAIKMAHAGEASATPDVQALLFQRVAFLKDKLKSIEDSDLSRLSVRELEVLQLISDGTSNKEIAAQLSLEVQTVKNHVHSILEKLRVSSRREAAVVTRRYIAG